MSFKPFKFDPPRMEPNHMDFLRRDSSLQRNAEIRSGLDRLSPLDQSRILDQPRFDWVRDSINPLRSRPVDEPFGGIADFKNEVNKLDYLNKLSYESPDYKTSFYSRNILDDDDCNCGLISCPKCRGRY